MTTNATTTPPTTAADLAEQLTAEGYTLDVPRWLGPDAVAIDCDVAATADCEACGRHGLRWQPWHRKDPRSYRCVAVCPDPGCAAAFEF